MSGAVQIRGPPVRALQIGSAGTAPVAAQPFQAGECPFLGSVTRAIGSLRPWLAQLRDNRRAARFDVGSIDDRTLDDIGLTRADMLYPGSKTARKSRLGLREDLRADL